MSLSCHVKPRPTMRAYSFRQVRKSPSSIALMTKEGLEVNRTAGGGFWERTATEFTCLACQVWNTTHKAMHSHACTHIHANTLSRASIPYDTILATPLCSSSTHSNQQQTTRHRTNIAMTPKWFTPAKYAFLLLSLEPRQCLLAGLSVAESQSFPHTKLPVNG